jgi:hypothetical protein
MRAMMSPFLGGRHASVCALDHVELRQNGAGGLPEVVQHRSGAIHVNCALIHAPIGLIPNPARKHLLAHRPHADLSENPARNMAVSPRADALDLRDAPLCDDRPQALPAPSLWPYSPRNGLRQRPRREKQ